MVMSLWPNFLAHPVCMYVIFIRCDGRTSDNKHKKQNQNNVPCKAEQEAQLSPRDRAMRRVNCRNYLYDKY